MLDFLLGKGRPACLAFAALVTALLGGHAADVPIEQSNESMDSFTSEERALYEEFQRVFGNDEALVLSVSHPDLLGTRGIALVDGLTRAAEAIDGVGRVHSLSNAIELVPGPYGAEPRSLLPTPARGEGYEERVREALRRNPELAGFLVSPDRRTAALHVQLETRPGDDAYRPRVVDALRDLLSDYEGGGVELHLAGITAQKLAVTRLLARDQAVLIPVSVVVLALVLAAFFRRPSGVVVPLLVTGVTLVWTLGIYGWSGFELNTMTSLLPPVLMVLSVSTSIHLYEGWRARTGLAGRARIATTVRDLARPCFFTSLTTALGMLSLTLSDTPAVRLFGAFTALGVMLSFAVGMTLGPVALSFLGERGGVAVSPPARRSPGLDAILGAIAEASLRHPGAIVCVALGVTAAAIAGMAGIRTSTDLVRFLKEDHPLYRDAMFVDENLGGIYTLELLVGASDGGSLATLDAVERLSRFRGALLAHEEVGGVDSVLSILDAVQRAGTGPAAGQGDEEAVLAAFDLIDAAGDEALVRQVIDPEMRRMRLRVRIRAVGTDVASPLEDAFLREASEILGPDYRVQVTGSFHRMARDSDRLVAQQVESFGLAFLLVILTIGVMFRSTGMMLASIVPNVIPILWTGGLMGLLGIELSTGTAMIASVVIGLGVDDTIHYLTRFERERCRGTAEAIRTTTTRTGRALAISSVVLVLGFWVGALGSFKPTIYFSLLTGVTMISALLCDLLVLPATLRLATRSRP